MIAVQMMDKRFMKEREADGAVQTGMVRGYDMREALVSVYFNSICNERVTVGCTLSSTSCNI